MRQHFAPRMTVAFALVAVSLVSFVSPAPVRAATVTATAFFDRADGQCATSGAGECTLREAVIYANAHSGTTIQLLTGKYLLTIGFIYSPSDYGSFKIKSNITIIGQERTSTIIDGSPTTYGHYRVFKVSDAVVAHISNVTIQNGNGGIYSQGNLTIAESDIRANQSSSGGGGITNVGVLTITNSSVNDNITYNGDGGAIFNYGTATITNSSIRANTLYYGLGGGIYNSSFGSPTGGTLTITGTLVHENTIVGGGGGSGTGIYSGGGANPSISMSSSTISRNMFRNADPSMGVYGQSVYIAGGQATFSNSTVSGSSGDRGNIGIANYAVMSLSHMTIANNVFGIVNIGGNLTVEHTLLKNTGANCSYSPDPPGRITSLGYNLSSDVRCGIFTNPSDRTNVDPRIGPLADNGGPTPTHALLPDSPAINAGGTSANGCLATDQRGIARPQGTACDIGAYEAVVYAQPPARPGAPTIAPPGPLPPTRPGGAVKQTPPPQPPRRPSEGNATPDAPPTLTAGITTATPNAAPSRR